MATVWQAGRLATYGGGRRLGLKPEIRNPKSGKNFSLAQNRERAFNGAMFQYAQGSPGSVARQSRREFIRHVGSALALGAVMPPFAESHAAESPHAAAQQTLVGSNIYGWGQYAQRDKKQLDVEEVISALRDTGYDYLETFLNVGQPEENAKLAEQLKAKGLQHKR